MFCYLISAHKSTGDIEIYSLLIQNEPFRLSVENIDVVCEGEDDSFLEKAMEDIIEKSIVKEEIKNYPYTSGKLVYNNFRKDSDLIKDYDDERTFRAINSIDFSANMWNEQGRDIICFEIRSILKDFVIKMLKERSAIFNVIGMRPMQYNDSFLAIETTLINPIQMKRLNKIIANIKEKCIDYVETMEQKKIIEGFDIDTW
jgi:hypothetical protein